MPRTVQPALLALLSIAIGGVGASAASAAIDLADPLSYAVHNGSAMHVDRRAQVLTSDLNRDGKADAIGGNVDMGLQTRLGGVGGLLTGQGINGTVGRRAAAIEDVNRDGHADLVRIQADSLTVALGNGSGSFGVTGPLVPLGGTCDDVALGDLDRDGDLDAVVVCANQLRVLLGDGSGGFASPVAQTLSTVDTATRVELADFDRDGVLDAVANDSVTGTVSFLRGRGDGTFDPNQPWGSTGAQQDLAIADIDRDGVLDLVGLPSASSGSATVQLHYGRGDGTSSRNETVDIPYVDSHTVEVADLDHDGRGDLVIAGPWGVFTAVGDGESFEFPMTSQTIAWSSAMALGDVDGDRRTDVVLLDPWGEELQVARNVTPERTPPNAFERITPEPATNNGPGYTASADLNRDGVPDLIVAQQTASRVGILLGNGDATFGSRGDYWAGANSPSQIVPADMNRDGIPDLVVGHGLNARVGVVLGNGDGSFQAPLTQDLPMFSQSVGVAVGDFDRDGIPDVATANDDGQRASVFRGNGDGTLGTPTNYSTNGGRASAIVTGDFDRDGKLDLAVVGSGFSARLNLLRGNGDGTFQAATVINLGSGSQPLALRAIDLDRDGDLDLVTANYGTASVSVLTNVGGGFASRTEYPTWGSPRGLDVGDVDGDRIPDVVFTDGVGDTVGLLRGNGDGTLATARSFTVGASPYGVAVAELDRDGRSEIAVPSYVQQTMAVLRGAVDTVAPSTTDNVPSGWSISGQVTLTATDTGGSGVARTYYTVGTNPAAPTTTSSVYGGPVTLTDGQRIKYFSVDEAGNAETVRTSEPIKVDDTAPVSTASFATGWQNAPVPVTLSATDAGSGVQQIRYTVGASPGAPGPSSAIYDPASKPTLSHGQKIRFRAVDVAGNWEASKPASAAAQVEAVVPTVTSDVTDAWSTAPVPVTLSPADTGGSGVAATYYEIGTPPATPTTASPLYDPASKPTLDDGQQIRFVTYDAAGNASTVETSVAVRVDEVAPTTTDDVPSGWRTAPVRVALDAADARSGVAATYYEVGVSPAAPTTSSAVYDPASTPTLHDGERIAYRSADVAGNLEDVRTSDAAKVDTATPDAPTLIAGPPPADRGPAPVPAPTSLRAILGDADGAGRRPVVLVAGQRGIACATDRGVVAACRLEARSVRRLTTKSGRRLPVGTVLAVGTSATGVAAGERLATDLRLTTQGRAARATHPLGLTARLVVTGTTPGGATVQGRSLIRLMTSDTLVIPVAGRSRTLSPNARLWLGRLVRTVGGQAKAVRCTADTDRSGDAAAEKALTVAQARTACRYLASRGLRATRTTEGRGSTRPRASNRTDRGRALNRRLTVRIAL